MRICDWCVRQIPWWRIRYCKNCAEHFRLNMPSGPTRPTYASEWLADARRRRKPKITWQ